VSEMLHALRTPDADSANRGVALAPTRLVQRKCGCGGTCGSCSPALGAADEEKKKKVQRRAIGETSSVIPRSVESILGSPGRPLDTDTRATMESRFDRSFAAVRVHTDSHAAASARAIDAAAYTSGTHIVFGAGRFEPGTTSGRHLLAHELAHVIQQRNGTALPSGVGPANDDHERAADRIADAVAAQGPVFAPPPAIVPTAERLVRRKREDDAPASTATEPPRFIVDDNEVPAAGQMRRGAFVDELDAAICATSREEMSRLGRSTEGCPLLEQWRPRIRAMGTRQLEVSLRRWVAGEAPVRTARDYIPRVAQRLAQSIQVWGATGRIAGIPPDLMELLGGGKIKVGVGSLLRGAIGGLFRKARDGAPAPAGAAPVALAEGRPLDAGVASRMGAAFGRDFSNVRIHTDAIAAQAATRQNARAFTLGNEIAFARGEYAPGTIVGDALLAHELAHVAQQDVARQDGAAGPLSKSEEASGVLERDADDAAVHAVVSLWPGIRRFARGMGKNAMPRLKTSLRLQRCSHIADLTVRQGDIGGFSQQADTNENGCTIDQRNTEIQGAGAGATIRSCCTPKMIGEIRALYPEALERVRNAIAMLAPDQRDHFNDQLGDHFGITSDNTEAVNSILANFRSILNLMQSTRDDTRAQILCRSRHSDTYCQHADLDATNFDFARTSCQPAGPPVIQFCGDYELSLPAGRVPGENQSVPAGRFEGAGPQHGLELRGRDAPFLYPRQESSPRTGETYNGWMRTIIHEHAHALCSNMLASGGPIPGRERYRRQDNYPGPLALRNPDSYAWFAIDVGRVKQTTPAPPDSAAAQQPTPPRTARESAERQRLGSVPDGCPPRLGALEMRIIGQPTLLAGGDRCSFQLQNFGRGGLVEGMQIFGTVGASHDCGGRLYWVQYTHERQMVAACPGRSLEGLCIDPGWGIDTGWPYSNASNHDLTHDNGALRVWLGDIPGMGNISGGSFTRVCFNHEFVTYLVYENPPQPPTPVAWMSWRMVATAVRGSGTCPAGEGGGCTGWHVLPNSLAEQTGASRVAGAMHPQVPLNRNAPTVMAGLGATACPPDSCPQNGLQP